MDYNKNIFQNKDLRYFIRHSLSAYFYSLHLSQSLSISLHHTSLSITFLSNFSIIYFIHNDVNALCIEIWEESALDSQSIRMEGVMQREVVGGYAENENWRVCWSFLF